MLTVEKLQEAALMQAIGNYLEHQQKWAVDLFSPKGLDIIFSRGKL